VSSAALGSMKEYALERVSETLETCALAIQEGARRADPASVHKMRVSIRRFQQCLRCFQQFLPKSGVESVKAQLKKVMEPAGHLRNHDIALDLVYKSGAEVPAIKHSRIEAKRRLIAAVQKLAKKDLSSKWRSNLELEEA
jgi:CHAD domain-containing protein